MGAWAAHNKRQVVDTKRLATHLALQQHQHPARARYRFVEQVYKKIEEEKKKKRRHLNRIFRIYQMLPLLHKACNVAYHLAGNYELTTITNGWQWP